MIKSPLYLLLFSLSIVFFSSCSYNTEEYTAKEGDVLLAKVEDKNLYLSEIAKTTFLNISKSDSLVVLNKYVENWIKEEVFLNKAKNNISNLEEIKNEVKTYERSIINSTYEKQLLKNIEVELTEDELVAYYNKHKEYFTFEEEYYKIKYVLLPKKTPNLAKIKKTISNGTTNHWLENFCHKEPNNCFIDQGTIKNLSFLKEQLKMINKQVKIGSKYKYHYIANDQVLIYKIVKIYKIGEIAPIEIIKDELTRLALHQKKQEHLQAIKEKTYQKAKNDKIFEKYIH